MITGWRFVSAPGADELLLGRFALSAAYRQTLYFVMDGEGRQLAVGDSSGFLVEADVSTDRGAWQYAGATQNGFTFDVNRQGSGAPGGVSYFRNRAYDSRTGRWKQEDPLGVAGGLNLYQFNGNNPATYTDPFGLCPIPPSSCLGAAGVSLAVGLIPGVGDAVDIAGAVVGRDLITGEGLSGAQRVATALGTLVGSGRAARQGVDAAATGVGKLVTSSGAHAAQEAAATAGRSWTTQRRRFWKTEAASEGAAERWGAGNISRMKRGNAPQLEGESVELHHTPLPRRDGGIQVEAVTPDQHRAVDPYRN